MTDATAPARLAPGPDLRRFALAVIPTGAAALFQLATFVLTGRALGPEAFGLLAATTAVATVASDLAGLGADSALVRSVATDSARLPAAWGHVLFMLLVSIPPVVLAAIGAAALLAPGLGLATVALVVCGDILVGRATAATEIAFVALGRPAAAGLVRLAAAGARAAAAVVAFVLLGTADPRVWAAIACAQSAATAAVLVRLVGGAPLRPDRASLGFGLLLMLNQLARTASANLDRIVLAALLAPASLGLYAAGTRLQLVGAIATQAATRIWHPRFFRAAEAGPVELARLTRSAAATMAAVGLLAAAAIAALAPLLPRLLGPEFAGTAGVAAALGLASPFVALQYPAADALTAAGRQRLRTVIYLVGAAMGALLLAAGSLAAGLWGAAAAAIAAQAGLAAALWLALFRTAPR